MKTLELSDATASLADYARDVSTEPIVLTVEGKPVAALISVQDLDWETISLSLNPQFIDLIERSRARQAAEGVVSSAEMRRRLRLKQKLTERE